MKEIVKQDVQTIIDRYATKNVYLHLETTNGAYASHFDQSFFFSQCYIRNASVSYKQGKIQGQGPYRVGLELEIGWIYAEGLTHYVINENEEFILMGLNYEGKIAVTLQLSEQPFQHN